MRREPSVHESYALEKRAESTLFASHSALGQKRIGRYDEDARAELKKRMLQNQINRINMIC